MTTTQVSVGNVKARQLRNRPQSLAISLILLSVCSLCALAQDSHQHGMTAQHQGQGNDPSNSANALIKIVRESTERFKDVSVAEAEGYALQFGCVSGPDSGAMGLHYVNGTLVNQGDTGPNQAPDSDLRSHAQRRAAADRRRLPTSCRCVGQEEPGSAAVDGAAFPLLRIPKSLWSAGVLYAACLGVEGKPKRRFRELAP